MNVTVIGAGYVGLVTAACLAELGHQVVGVDRDHGRVALLQDGALRAERAYEAARRGYGAGLTDLETALGAEQAWRATRSQYTAAQVLGQRRAVQAFKALGGGWPAATAPAPSLSNTEAR